MIGFFLRRKIAAGFWLLAIGASILPLTVDRLPRVSTLLVMVCDER